MELGVVDVMASVNQSHVTPDGWWELIQLVGPIYEDPKLKGKERKEEVLRVTGVLI